MANTFISIETFEEIISTYKASLKHNQRNIYLVSQDEYEDIKKALLADHIVHVKLNDRKEKATNNINKNIHSLPVLIRENMYRIFCSAHLDVSHKKLAGTYDKLRSKWGNINKKLVQYFCEKCSICAVRVNRKFGSEVAGKAIIAKNFLSRLQ
ncbi:7285_t:CDS:2, partial [Funneliformis geosporum]